MHTYRSRSSSLTYFQLTIMVAAVLCTITVCCKAQVTFSRDWSAGKRAADGVEFHTKKLAMSPCHLILSQIRQLAAYEPRSEDLDMATPFYVAKI